MAASSLSDSSDCSEDNEGLSLIQQPVNVKLHDNKKRCPCPLGAKFMLPIITEKGAIVMIMWNLFFAISLFTCSEFKKYTYGVQTVIVSSSTVMYPLIGWLADSRFGKFKVLRAASVSLMIAIILKNVGIFILPSTLMYFQYASLLLWSLAWACDLSCIIPFATDQSVGASAEQLSFTVHWLLWGFTTGYSIATFTCPLTGNSQDISQFLLTLISFVIAFICLEACRHLVMTKPMISNPMKLIAKVLNYARKHKYPERRSALTYWEEDYPSRLDMGKDKYGGPFTFEQVEDVKTVFRLIPLLVCINTFNMLFWQKSHLMYYYSNCSSNYMHFLKFASDYPQLYATLIYSAGLPIYCFLIFPLIRNYVFTIIRRIGMGMLLMIVAFLASAIAELVDATPSDMLATSMFNNLTSAECPTSYKLMLTIAPELLKSMGGVVVMSGMYELIIAQTPQHIKGLVLCIGTETVGLFVVPGFAINKLLSSFPVHFFPGCLFYYYISYFTFGALTFTLYVLVAKWYKLRIRDDIVPYHKIAEDYFEREQANRLAYIRV